MAERACARACRGQVIVQLFRCATSPCDLSFMLLFPATTQLPLTPSVLDVAGITAKFSRMRMSCHCEQP